MLQKLLVNSSALLLPLTRKCANCSMRWTDLRMLLLNWLTTSGSLSVTSRAVSNHLTIWYGNIYDLSCTQDGKRNHLFCLQTEKVIKNVLGESLKEFFKINRDLVLLVDRLHKENSIIDDTVLWKKLRDLGKCDTQSTLESEVSVNDSFIWIFHSLNNRETVI